MEQRNSQGSWRRRQGYVLATVFFLAQRLCLEQPRDQTMGSALLFIPQSDMRPPMWHNIRVMQLENELTVAALLT